MARTIDGVERRRDLSEAVWRIIRRDGFEAASVRAVAAEASLSTGSVRHFFASQDGLHVFAMEALVDRVGTRVRAALEEAGTAADEYAGSTSTHARRAVTSVLLELLPLTPERHDLYRTQLQFIARATVSPVLHPMAATMAEEVDRLVAHLVQLLVDAGAVRPDLDVPQATATLALLLDGVNLRLLTAPSTLSRVEAARVVDGLLDTWGER